MKTNESIETYLPCEFEKIMRETVKPDMERFVYGLEDLCDSVTAIRNGELHYYGGLHTGYRVGYLPYTQKDCVFANLWLFRNLKGVSLSSEYGETRLFMSRWPKSLESVSISGECDSSALNSLPNLAPLADKPIETLVLPKSSVLDFTPLSTMRKLRHLYINDSLIADLSCLAGLDKLESLNIQRCTAIKDFAPLVDLPNLREVKADPEMVRKFPDELLKKLDMTRPEPCPVPRHQFCH